MEADFFPGFKSQYIQTGTGCSIFTRVSGVKEEKPPLILLHGYPQTHVEFHKIAPLLVPHFTLVLIDLRGYGSSSTVPSANGSGYSKRLMAQDCVSVMQTLGYDKFSIVGHDRGARVAYRLAFDMPEKLDRVVVIDILPTAHMFRSFGNTTAGLKAYHWLFLAQPEPFPERLIQSTDRGRFFLEHTLTSWTAKRDLQDFGTMAIEQYREAFCNETRIHAACEDYRAGAFFDRVYDEEDLNKGRKIEVPVLAVWGSKGMFAETTGAHDKDKPLEVWRIYATNVEGKSLPCGHFVPEEDPHGMVAAILPFFGITGN